MIKDAEGGCVDAIFELVPFLERYPLEPDFRRILKWLYQSLDPAKIPSNGSPPLFAVLLAMYSLSVLSVIDIHRDRPEFSSILKGLETHWPRMWKWMSFLQFTINGLSPASLRGEVIAFLVNPIHDLYRADTHFTSLVCSTAGVLSMLVRLWYLEVNAMDGQDAESPYYKLWGTLLSHMSTVAHQQPLNWAKEVAAGAEAGAGGAMEIVRAAVKHLRVEVFRPSIETSHIHNCVTLITYLSNDQGLCDALISQDAMRRLCSHSGLCRQGAMKPKT